MATSTQELARETWRPYFDELIRTLGTVEATVEVIGRDLGAQVEAERLVLTGISYDDRDDVLVIGLDAPGKPDEDLERMVDRPRRIMVATSETPREEMTIDVEDAEGNRTLVHVERPPALPAT
jgi:uncharacterized protein DUF5335